MRGLIGLVNGIVIIKNDRIYAKYVGEHLVSSVLEKTNDTSRESDVHELFPCVVVLAIFRTQTLYLKSMVFVKTRRSQSQKNNRPWIANELWPIRQQNSTLPTCQIKNGHPALPYWHLRCWNKIFKAENFANYFRAQVRNSHFCFWSQRLAMAELKSPSNAEGELRNGSEVKKPRRRR